MEKEVSVGVDETVGVTSTEGVTETVGVVQPFSATDIVAPPVHEVDHGHWPVLVA